MLLLFCLFAENSAAVTIQPPAEIKPAEIKSVEKKPVEKKLVEQFIQQATELQLAQSAGWLNLLHYKNNLLGQRISQTDDPDFFLAEKGATDPQAELLADIRGFFSLPVSGAGAPTNSLVGNIVELHAQCRFPARLHWLKQQLAPSQPGQLEQRGQLAQWLPQVQCADLISWQEQFKAVQITLLFPSMHLDNPASMFGHTFIRFDALNKNHLLSQTLNYAAATDDTDSMLVYSWKGVTGGYTGRFSIRPFYETLLEYSDIEQRDIWEYSLNLSEAEITQLVRHLWEVRDVNFNYYFLRENCAYRLLTLLDVARPDMNMSLYSHPLYAVPVDTVRDIQQAGLISGRYYRPSTHNKISQMMQQMDKPSNQAALGIINKQKVVNDLSQALSVQQQAQVLQLADEILHQQKNPSLQEQDLQLKILSQRSHLPVTTKGVEFNFTGNPPEISHKSARWQFSAGEMESQTFYEIGIRPTFHDDLDNYQGFIQGATVSVLDTQFRWYPEKDKLQLELLNLFSMRSIVAVTPWIAPLSRQLSFKIKQRETEQAESISVFETQFAMGMATELKGVLLYLLAETQLEYAGKLKNNHGWLLGAETGLMWHFKNKLFSGQSIVSYQGLQQLSGEPGDQQRFNVGLQINLGLDHGLRLEYENKDYEQFVIAQTRLSYMLYF